MNRMFWCMFALADKSSANQTTRPLSSGSFRNYSYLCKTMTTPIEHHPLEPFLPENARLLFLGSFPKIVDFLNQKGIALYDTATTVRRLKDNASDAFLEIVEPTDIRALLRRIPQCHAIATTGEKATGEVCRHFGMDKIPALGSKTELEKGLFLYRLPSSSRAYPLSFEKKTAAYQAMFQEVFPS